MNHTIEVSPSGRAACRSCGQKIAKGELRLGEAVASQFSDTGFTHEWHHLPCAAKKKQAALRAALDVFTGEVPNRAELSAEIDTASGPTPAAAPKAGVPGALPTADLAPTSRAKCIQCQQAIAAKSVRIGVEREIDTGSFVTKGAGYLHPACVADWIESEGVDLASFVAEVLAHTALTDLPPPFGAAVEGATQVDKAQEKPAAASAANEALPPFEGVTEKALRALGKKLNGVFDTNGYKHSALIQKTTSNKQRDDLLWYLTEHRLVDAEKNAGILYRLSEIKEKAPKGAIVALLRRLTATPKELYKNESQGQRYMVPGWFRMYDVLAVEALRSDRVALEAALPELPPAIRLGVEFVRGRSGLPISDADRKAIGKSIAAVALDDQGVLFFTPNVVKGDKVETPFEIETRDCHETLPRLAAMFGMDDAGWDKALEAGLAKGTWSTVIQVARGLKNVPLGDLVQMLVSRSSDVERDPGVLFSVLDARADSTTDVIAAAKTLQAGYGAPGDVREVLLVWAISRRAAKGESFSIGDLDFGKSRGPMTADYLNIVKKAPREESLALLRRDFGNDRRTSLSTLVFILSVHFDDALLRDYLSIFDQGWNQYASLGRETAALFGPEALSALVDAYNEKDDDKRRTNLIADIVENLASRSGPLNPLEQSAVDALGAAVIDISESSPYLQTYQIEPTARLVARLKSPERRELLLQKIRQAKFPSQAFRFVSIDTDRACRVAAARALSERNAKLEDQDMRAAVKEFGTEAPSIFAEALGQEKGSTTFLAAIESVLGKDGFAAFAAARGLTPKNWYEQLKDMCAEAKGDRERIYLLEPPYRVEDLKLQANPKSWSRLGGRGPGIEAPKSKNETLEHVLTIDLEEAPELAKLFPGARAVSLYVPDAQGGTKYEASELVEVPATATPPSDGKALFVLALDVPKAIFHRSAAAKDPIAEAIRIKVLNAPGYALGEPMWIQEPEPFDLVMQISGSLDINVGDSGSLYVGKNEFIMQSH